MIIVDSSTRGGCMRRFTITAVLALVASLIVVPLAGSPASAMDNCSSDLQIRWDWPPADIPSWHCGFVINRAPYVNGGYPSVLAMKNWCSGSPLPKDQNPPLNCAPDPQQT